MGRYDDAVRLHPIREWKRILARAAELHYLTGLPMYSRIVRDAEQELRHLEQQRIEQRLEQRRRARQGVKP